MFLCDKGFETAFLPQYWKALLVPTGHKCLMSDGVNCWFKKWKTDRKQEHVERWWLN